MNSATMPDQQRNLLNLPGEIRQTIYRHYFAFGIPVKPTLFYLNDNFGITFASDILSDAPILFTCRQVYQEARSEVSKNFVLDLKSTPYGNIRILFRKPSLMARSSSKSFPAVDIMADYIFERSVEDIRGLLSSEMPPISSYYDVEKEEAFAKPERRSSAANDERGQFLVPLLRCHDNNLLQCLGADLDHIEVLRQLILLCEFLDEYPFVREIVLRRRIDEAFAKRRDAATACRALSLMLLDKMRHDSTSTPPLDAIYKLNVEYIAGNELLLSILRR